MGEHRVKDFATQEQLRSFMRRLLTDIQALEQILESGMIETGIRRIGAEQEMFLVDEHWHPAPVAMDVIEKAADPHFTNELALYNLEANLDPLTYGGDCLSRMETQLRELVAKADRVAEECNARVLLAGILPTLRKSDLGLANMTPNPRYKAINDALMYLKGEDRYEFRIRGVDELLLRHDSVMVESANASFQVHFQVGAEEFPNLYNIAQAVAGPVLAASTNSPLLFGRRLWCETRIALFEQAVDTRTSSDHLRDRLSRVSFGRDWVRNSVLELFREDVARFRSVLGDEIEENPFDMLDSGEVPSLMALRLHNGTVYRWNRACYGLTGGKPHLRIENRVLPSGPTPLDEMANAAFWFGIIGSLAEDYHDITRHMEFEDAKANFQAAARHGLESHLTWLDGKNVSARDLLLEELIPRAREGLAMRDIASGDIDLYLGVFRDRVRSWQTGTRWTLNSFQRLREKHSSGEALNAIVAATLERQRRNEPVSTWSPAQAKEAGGLRQNFLRVEQYMTTDLFTVHEDELLDLVANLMEWEKIRHVPVEDSNSHLVGLVSYRALLRLQARGQAADGKTVPVKDIMRSDPITVNPDTSTLTAVRLMRENSVGCLPVVRDGRLVGMVTERDFMHVAAELLEEELRD